MEQTELLEQRRTKFVDFFKNNINYLSYLILLPILLLGWIIRTRNVKFLKDVVTGKYIPLALDPHVFLRYSTYLLEHGSLYINDLMRNVPVGYDMTQLTIYPAYFIVYIYKFFKVFFTNLTIDHLFIYYPVITFLIGIVFFYLLVKELFDWKVAAISSFFLTILPTYLYRSMAGFADHDILNMMFWYMAFYFFVKGWKTRKVWLSFIFGILAGIFTGYQGLSGGNVKFTLIIIGVFVLVELILNKLEGKDFLQFIGWMLSSYCILSFMTNKYHGIMGLCRSFTSGIALLALGVGIVHFILIKFDWFKIKSKLAEKLPVGICSFIITSIIGFVTITIIKPSFFIIQIKDIYVNMLYAMGKTRWALTVAEQHQPYFVTLLSQMSSLYVMAFIVGSMVLFFYMTKHFSVKIRKCSFMVYVIFLVSFVMSRYASGSMFDGETLISKIIYIGSLLCFIIYIGGGYLYAFYKNKDLFNKIKQIDRKYIFLFIWFILMLIAMRTASRLFFELSPVTTI